MKIAIGCDEAAFDLKETLKEFLISERYELTDFGTFDRKPVLYPDIAHTVATAVARHEFDRGVLLCGTGIGMAISANKVKGIRAALCHDAYSAQRARMSNDAQIITMGARVIGPELAKVVLKEFLNAEFAGGRSTPKVERIIAYENDPD